MFGIEISSQRRYHSARACLARRSVQGSANLASASLVERSPRHVPSIECNQIGKKFVDMSEYSASWESLKQQISNSALHLQSQSRMALQPRKRPILHNRSTSTSNRISSANLPEAGKLAACMKRFATYSSDSLRGKQGAGGSVFPAPCTLGFERDTSPIFCGPFLFIEDIALYEGVDRTSYSIKRHFP